jgi:hypothetical protein
MMTKEKDANSLRPRLMSKAHAAAYCGVSLPTFGRWVAAGTIPAALPIKMWDRKAIDLALDKLSGLTNESQPIEVAFDKWEREHEARKAAAETPLEKWRREQNETSDGMQPRESTARHGRQSIAKRSRDAEIERILSLSPEEYVADRREAQRQWTEAIPGRPLNKREQNALREMLAVEASWVERNKVKSSSSDTIERLTIRGFIVTRPHGSPPDNVSSLKLTEAGISAVKALGG